MEATVSRASLLLPSTFSLPSLALRLPFNPQKPTPRRHFSFSSVRSNPKPTTTAAKALPETFISRFAADEPRKGSDVLVEALEREGVTNVFASQGVASLEIHKALRRSTTIRNVTARHEQGGVFATNGYARASGLPGVCFATTSGAGATNLASGLADALLDSVPIVVINEQVPSRTIGTDGFQETSTIVEVTRSITKHNYLVLDVEDIPRTVREAFFIASSGRPGPVLINIPKDILQQQMVVPNWDQPIKLPDYTPKLPKPPNEPQLEQIVRLISESKRPVLYVGGGCLDSSEELRRFVELTGIPVACSLMGIGAYPCSDELCLQLLGMHGTVYANYGVDKSDLLLALGVSFDDRAIRKLETFASQAKIVHIDIDSVEIGKNKQAHWPFWADVKLALNGMNMILERKEGEGKLDFSAWRQELKMQKIKNPSSFKTFEEAIPPQYAIQVLGELTKGNAIITTGGAGQHQIWAACFYKFNTPRQWLTSGGLGFMGFGLPVAIGAAVARPDAVVVDIDGERSFLMNVQELGTIGREDLPVKIMLLSNRRPGMVRHWDDPVKLAQAWNIPAARVTKKEDVRAAIQKMLDTPGPYLLDVVGPYEWSGALEDVITQGNGTFTY
ncbi:acetolactate synthase 2, chloroplastic-like [Cornus florida]|uniref:acetolactate synthase 2, chloroplastic-like n=1 Tax=Cornus florida TaxID=4283 RepID=UPI00289BB371|nr:acetolactate synthase 2, chloroplastic-like [Cornus florida]